MKKIIFSMKKRFRQLFTMTTFSTYLALQTIILEMSTLTELLFKSKPGPRSILKLVAVLYLRHLFLQEK